jgi:hypothetical protein
MFFSGYKVKIGHELPYNDFLELHIKHLLVSSYVRENASVSFTSVVKLALKGLIVSGTRVLVMNLGEAEQRVTSLEFLLSGSVSVILA